MTARPVPVPGRGFTLFELLVALAIMSLVAAVVLPSLTSGLGAELRATAGTLAAGLRQTRSRALTAGKPLALTVDSERHGFIVGGEERLRTVPERVALALYGPDGEPARNPEVGIRFFSDGSSSGGGIRVGPEDQAYYVDVEWLTGQVRVLDSPPERRRP